MENQYLAHKIDNREQTVLEHLTGTINFRFLVSIRLSDVEVKITSPKLLYSVLNGL